MTVLVGQHAPDFKAQAVVGSDFQEITLSQFHDKKYVILFFYPCPAHIHDFLSYNEAFADDKIRKLFLRRILILVFSQFLFLSSCLLVAFYSL